MSQPLILPNVAERYDARSAREQSHALEQFAGQLHSRTSDIDHPHSVTIRKRVIYPWQTFTQGDATPSVATGRNFKTANTSATTITDFDDGEDGQEILVRVNDANTTFDFSASSLVGNSGQDYAAADGDMLFAVYDAAEDVWYCDLSNDRLYG